MAVSSINLIQPKAFGFVVIPAGDHTSLIDFDDMNGMGG